MVLKRKKELWEVPRAKLAVSRMKVKATAILHHCIFLQILENYLQNK